MTDGKASMGEIHACLRKVSRLLRQAWAGMNETDACLQFVS
jgi:hypothetical protein